MREVARRAVTRGVVKTMVAAGAVSSLVLGMVVFALPASASQRSTRSRQTGPARAGTTDTARPILQATFVRHQLTEPDDMRHD